MSTSPLLLGGTTYSWLHQDPLRAALDHLADAGVHLVELTTAAPHLQATACGIFERHELLRAIRSRRMEITSTNPGFLDINLISPNDEFRRTSLDAILAELELAHDLEAPQVVLMPGRRHALSPAPAEACDWWLDKALGLLLDRADQLGVGIALEPSPHGFRGDVPGLVEVIDRIAHPRLAMTFDVANIATPDDPTRDVRTAGHRIRLAHVSDTWCDRWAHTSPGRGNVDFGAYADALREVGFDGVTIYELVDGQPPLPRLDDDIATFGTWGWKTGREQAGTVGSRTASAGDDADEVGRGGEDDGHRG